MYLLWALPAVLIVSAIGSGRFSTTYAALIGLVAAVAVAVISAPTPFAHPELLRALARGLWIGLTIVPYILGGLLFWQIAAQKTPREEPDRTEETDPAVGSTRLSQRRRIFLACFLIGPFAEAATGFGVGMLGTAALIRGLGMAPRRVLVLTLLSQTMIPWGAMGSGTLLAAAYARMPATQLSLLALGPVSALMLVWLTLYWRTCRDAGYGTAVGEIAREVLWIAAALGLLAFTTWYLGPETALLVAYGPVIVVHHLVYRPANDRSLRVILGQVAPYALLIAWLVATRLVQPLRDGLFPLWLMRPFEDLPAWSPLFHAGTWLFLGALATAAVRGSGHELFQQATSAWNTGKSAVYALFAFAMMAEVLSVAGISGALAQAAFGAHGGAALFAAPMMGMVFGVLTNSGNAPNSLFMASQLSMAAQAGLNVPLVAAIQHVAGTSVGFFSPVRISIAAQLAASNEEERSTYRTLLPYGLATVTLLLLTAAYALS